MVIGEMFIFSHSAALTCGGKFVSSQRAEYACMLSKIHATPSASSVIYALQDVVSAREEAKKDG